VAMHCAPFFDVTTLSSATLAAWLVRYFWRTKVPDWAKEDVSFRNLLLRRKKPSTTTITTADGECERDGDLSASQKEEREMSNLSSVLEKLQALVDSVQLDDDHPTMLQQHAALLAFVQLSVQIKKQEQKQQQSEQPPEQPPQSFMAREEEEEEEKKEDKPSSPRVSTNQQQVQEQEEPEEAWTCRDSMYAHARPCQTALPHVPPQYYEFCQHPSSSPQVLETLQDALKYATWAYYENSIILEDVLAEQDLQLLEHSSQESSRPGHVAYFVAVSSTRRKQLIVGVRGTTTLEDIVTDCCGRQSFLMIDRTITTMIKDHDGTKAAIITKCHALKSKQQVLTKLW